MWVKEKFPIPALILSPVAIYIPNRYLYISNKLHSIYIWLLQILLIDREKCSQTFSTNEIIQIQSKLYFVIFPFQFLMTIHLDLSVTLVAE